MQMQKESNVNVTPFYVVPVRKTQELSKVFSFSVSGFDVRLIFVFVLS